MSTYKTLADALDEQLPERVNTLGDEYSKAQHITQASQANLDVAKIGTEQAKASNLQSDTDLKDLDFVEQESGVKQEREKELRATQAQSQADLAVIQHKLKSKEQDKDHLKEYLLKSMDLKAKQKENRTLN